jgi:hypothetical protein
MTGIETVFLGFIVAAFAVFILLLQTLEISERRKVGYLSGPIPLKHPSARAANNDTQVQKAA